MLRRQVLSFDDWARPEYGSADMIESSPRKWRTVQAAPLRQTTLARAMSFAGGAVLRGLWGERYHYDPNHPWIGRRFIPWDTLQVEGLARQVRSAPGELSELEVARLCRSNIYRLLYARLQTDPLGNSEWIVASIPSVEYRPARLNLILSPGNVVLAVFYG